MGKQQSKKCIATLKLSEHLSNFEPQFLPKILKTLIELAIFEENQNQWSLSRPMFPLILLSGEAVFLKIQKELISKLPNELQEHATKYLHPMTTEIEKKLDSKNRDRFTQQLVACRYAMKKQ